MQALKQNFRTVLGELIISSMSGMALPLCPALLIPLTVLGVTIGLLEESCVRCGAGVELAKLVLAVDMLGFFILLGVGSMALLTRDLILELLLQKDESLAASSSS